MERSVDAGMVILERTKAIAEEGPARVSSRRCGRAMRETDAFSRRDRFLTKEWENEAYHRLQQWERQQLKQRTASEQRWL